MGIRVPVICRGTQFGSIKALCEHYGADRGKVTRRLNQGWTADQALNLTARRKKGSRGNPIELDGICYESLVDAAEALGRDPHTVASRVAKGYSVKDALSGNLKGHSGHRGKPIVLHGKTYDSREQLCAQFGQRWGNVQRRVNRGWTMEQALLIEPAPPRFRNFEGHARDQKWKEVRITEGKAEPIPDAGGYKLYVVTNVVTGKVYVGITVTSLEQRLKQHFAAARKGRKSAFSNALRKYGEQAFKIELIRSNAKTYDELQEMEVLEIAKRDCIRNGYNIAKGGSIGTSKGITVAGKSYPSYAMAALAHGVDPTVFALRVTRLKWTPDQAAEIATRDWEGKAVAITVEGKAFRSIREAAVAYAVGYGTAWKRYRQKGWTVEQALGIELPPPRHRRASEPATGS